MSEVLEQYVPSSLDDPAQAEVLPMYRQVDERLNDNVFVELLFEQNTKEPSVRVEDRRSGEMHHFKVLGATAYEAFMHPFPHVPGEGLIEHRPARPVEVSED